MLGLCRLTLLFNTTLTDELQVLHKKVARLSLDLPSRTSKSDALGRLGWKPLERQRVEHCTIFTYKYINNLFMHPGKWLFNSSFHSYNTRHKGNIRRPCASRRWGHQTTLNFAAANWNALDLSVRQTPPLPSPRQLLTAAYLNFLGPL